MFVMVLTAEINHEHRDAAVQSTAVGVWIPAFRNNIVPPSSGRTMRQLVPARRWYPVTKRTVSRHFVQTRHWSTNYQLPISGTHNSSELNLFWESESPVTVNKDLHLTEYRLVNLWSNFTVANYSLTSEVSTSFGLHSRVYGKFGE